MEKTRALLLQSQAPKDLWGEAVLTATQLINKLPSSSIKFQSLLSMFNSFFPDIIFEIGCVCYVHMPKFRQDKLEGKAIKCVLLDIQIPKNGKSVTLLRM